MTYVGFEEIDRLRVFSCPARASRIYEQTMPDGRVERVKTPTGPVQQLVAVGHFLRRRAVGTGSVILLPVPPGTRVLPANYPSFFWHLERQILGPGKPPPMDMGIITNTASAAVGEQQARIVGTGEVWERWGVEPEHPLGDLYLGDGEPQFLELTMAVGRGACEFKPVFYLTDPLPEDYLEDFGGNPHFLPLSITVASQDADRSTSLDPDERWMEMRRRARQRGPRVGWDHRVYLVNCGRVGRRDDLREAGWQLKRGAVPPEVFYQSVDSSLLPEAVCIGGVRSLLRLRPTEPRNEDLYV